MTAAARTLLGVLSLLRVSNLPTIWTNVLGALLLSGAVLDAALLVPLALSLSAFYVGGMALNDLWDLEWDRAHRPERPLPSGQVSVEAARILVAGLFGAAFALLLAAPQRAGLAAGVVLLAAIVVYDRLHKRTALAVLAMAACRFLAYVVVAAAATGGVAGPVWLAAGVQAVWVLALSVVARSHARRGGGPELVPWLIAGIALLDGLLLALLVAPAWLLAGLGDLLLTRLAQQLVPGD